MPQMNKGGKFIFGKSLIRDNLTIHLPPQALAEYNAAAEGKVYLFTGSKVIFATKHKETSKVLIR